jgi:hypothetical protein
VTPSSVLFLLAGRLSTEKLPCLHISLMEPRAVSSPPVSLWAFSWNLKIEKQWKLLYVITLDNWETESIKQMIANNNSPIHRKYNYYTTWPNLLITNFYILTNWLFTTRHYPLPTWPYLHIDHLVLPIKHLQYIEQTWT